MQNMKCPKCNGFLKRVNVRVDGAKSSAISFQCANCDYFSFEKSSSAKVLAELQPLQIRQKIVKLSADRLGIYFNSNIVRSLDLKKGCELYLSVPDKKHIVIEVGK